MSKIAEVTRLEAESVRLAREAAAMLKEVQAECLHPYTALEFTSGAVQSYMAHGTERQVYVRCSTCDKRMTTNVMWHADL